MAAKGQIGPLNPLYGRKRPPFTDEHRSNIAKAAKGRYAGSKNYFWKGGRKQNNGYIKVHVPAHPCADKDGYVYEHRLVLEQRLGRFLLPEERPHHINGDRRDNRPENLELFANNGRHMIDGGHVKRDPQTGQFVSGHEHNDLPWRAQEGGCQILVASWFYDIDDPRYPKEWVCDDDGANPRCTAFDSDAPVVIDGQGELI